MPAIPLVTLNKASNDKQTQMARREFLRSALVGAAGIFIGSLMSGCSDNKPEQAPAQPTSTASKVLFEPERTPARPTSTGSRVLLAYFSRAGENYYYGGRTNLDAGNTEVLAGMISQISGCNVHRIEPVDHYPEDYSETVERNVREQEANVRPVIANPLASIEPYDTVLLGSPIWNVRASMIMTTFVEGFDFTGKTVIPFTTHAMSGLGTTVRDYTTSCPDAMIGEGLAVRGEEVREAGAAVEAWLRKINLLKT
jgi:flavodoxin